MDNYMYLIDIYRYSNVCDTESNYATAARQKAAECVIYDTFVVASATTTTKPCRCCCAASEWTITHTRNYFSTFTMNTASLCYFLLLAPPAPCWLPARSQQISLYIYTISIGRQRATSEQRILCSVCLAVCAFETGTISSFVWSPRMRRGRPAETEKERAQRRTSKRGKFCFIREWWKFNTSICARHIHTHRHMPPPNHSPDSHFLRPLTLMLFSPKSSVCVCSRELVVGIILIHKAIM